MATIALAVANKNTPSATAVVIHDRLVALGHTVVYTQVTESPPTCDAGYISPGATGSMVAGWKTATFPIICAAYTYADGPDLNLIASTIGNTSSQTQVRVVDAAHLTAGGLAAGLHAICTTSGTIRFAITANVGTGDESYVLEFSTNADRKVGIAYAAGGLLSDGTTAAPGKRYFVGFDSNIFHDGTNPNLTTAGEDLAIDGPVAWALDGANTNPVPVIGPITQIKYPQGSATPNTYTLDGTGTTDAEDLIGALTPTWAILFNGVAVVPDLTDVWAPTFTLAADSAGTLDVTLSVADTDGGEAEVAETFVIGGTITPSSALRRPTALGWVSPFDA